MLFTSAAFFVFLPAVFALFYLPPLRPWQTWVLVAASFFFYAWGQPWLLALLVLSALITGLASHGVLHAATAGRRRLWAAAGVAVNLAVLGFFKYFNLIHFTLTGAHHSSDTFIATLLALPLPIGISFYTFHGISLLIDTLRMGDRVGLPAGRPGRPDTKFSLGVLLYLTFFPQLVAGPIVKAREFFPQIRPHALRDIDWEGAFKALVTGYFLKTVVADNLQEFTAAISYPMMLSLPSSHLLLLLFAYSAQIFADFAGYSLIAIGLARLFGYELPVNFRFPYIAESFSEFWTRWHISLSTWLREYLYFPLGGNRRGRLRTHVNLMIVMFLGGLWHGAAWSYAIWGTAHGLALSAERMAAGSAFYTSRHVAVRAARMALVFLVVTFAWLLFKLPDFHDVIAYFRTLRGNRLMPLQAGPALTVLLYCLPVAVYHALYLLQRSDGPSWRRRFSPARPLLLGLMLAAILLNAGPPTAFIYFQF